MKSPLFTESCFKSERWRGSTKREKMRVLYAWYQRTSDQSSCLSPCMLIDKLSDTAFRWIRTLCRTTGAGFGTINETSDAPRRLYFSAGHCRKQQCLCDFQLQSWGQKDWIYCIVQDEQLFNSIVTPVGFQCGLQPALLVLVIWKMNCLLKSV